jgi:hypothetical protein
MTAVDDSTAEVSEEDSKALRRIAFDQSLRAHDVQVSALEALQTRSTNLLGAVTAGTAFFLGAAAAVRLDRSGVWVVRGIGVAFVVVAIGTIWNIKPQRNWYSSVSATVINTGYIGKFTLDESLEALGDELQGYWDAQEKRLKWLGRRLTVAMGAATIEVALFVVLLAWVINGKPIRK